MRTVILSILLSMSGVAEANNTVGVRLGAVQVGDRTERDVIKLPVCNGSSNIPVNSIQLHIKRKPVQIDKVKVVFHNNQEQLLTVKKHMKAGENTRWLDLNGNARCIKKIVFVGDADTRRVNSKKQSSIVVFGKAKVGNAVETSGNASPTVQSSADTPQIHKLARIQLGEQTERDTQLLPPCNTEANQRVSQVRVVVKNHPAEINRVRIQFQNGTDQVFNVNRHLAVGQMSPWVDLQGGSRCIQRITFVGDADTVGFKPNARSTVVVQGR
jgi:hypothetical protein